MNVDPNNVDQNNEEDKAPKKEKDTSKKEPISELGEPTKPTEIKAEEIRAEKLPPAAEIKERAAGWIAMLLVAGFLILLFIPFLLFIGYPISDTNFDIVAKVVDLIKTVASVLSGIVGAVVGYYFRVEREERAS